MDKINFSNVPSPHTELQLARWYTTSCILITLMLIGMCSIYFTQWRIYRHAVRVQKARAAHNALAQEYQDLQTQQKQRTELRAARKITHHQLTALNEALAQDVQLNECTIAHDGHHTLTITTPSRQRAQECIALLNKKQLFGTLSISSLKTVKSGEKSHLLVIIKVIPGSKQT
jgi:hypothetical protein